MQVSPRGGKVISAIATVATEAGAGFISDSIGSTVTAPLKTDPEDETIKNTVGGVASGIASQVSVPEAKETAAPVWWADKKNVPEPFTGASSNASFNSARGLINFGIGEIFGGLGQIGYTLVNNWWENYSRNTSGNAGSSSDSSSGYGGSSGGGGGSSGGGGGSSGGGGGGGSAAGRR